jgi:1-phosphofructokinase
MMIYTVTLNPSLDKTLAVPELRPGELHRGRVVRLDLGGKGINVSRALQALGIHSRLAGFAGGATGEALRSGLIAQGYQVDFIDVGGETRQNITLLDESVGKYTKINEPGPLVSPDHLTDFEHFIRQELHGGDWWVFSGSLPPGAPDDTYGRLIQVVQEGGGLAFLDSSGTVMAAGLKAKPHAIKPNREEAEELLQRSLDSQADLAWAAEQFQAMGIPMAAISLGAEGLALAMNGQLALATPPPVTARSPVGAGDSALAGLLWARQDGCDLAQTAIRATACGAAAAMQEGTGVGERALVEELARQVKVRLLEL